MSIEILYSINGQNMIDKVAVSFRSIFSLNLRFVLVVLGYTHHHPPPTHHYNWRTKGIRAV